MSEYWKSTPSYWCKFCSQYVRDSPLERRNHESSPKHQNNIQRSLRELHRGREREERDKQRAKDEVARLNGLVGGKGAPAAATNANKSAVSNGHPQSRFSGSAPLTTGAHTAAQRKAHAEQLAAMGIELPDELKEEISGVGEWKVSSERVVEDTGGNGEGGGGRGGRSLAEIIAEMKEGGGEEERTDTVAIGIRKRKAEDEEDEEDEGGGAKRKAWGNNFKAFPGVKTEAREDLGDLDALLSGVGKKKEDEAKAEVKREGEFKEEVVEEAGVVKKEKGEEDSIAAVPAADVSSDVKRDDAPPPVVFKKRKGKR